MARTSRVRRKDIKRPDEFITLSGQAIAWLRANSQLATGVAVVLVIALAAAGAITAYRASQSREANIDLAAALNARGSDQAASARAFGDAASRWRGSVPGDLAAILSAGTAVRVRNFDAAILTLQDLLDGGRLAPYLAQAALCAWGAALEGQGKWTAAADKYATAMTLEGPYGGPALVGQARSLQAAGQTDKAKDLFRNYYQQYPDAPDRDLVRDKAGL